LIEACVDFSSDYEYFRVSGMQSSDACRTEQSMQAKVLKSRKVSMKGRKRRNKQLSW
jgi:hypothetical protein